MLDEVGKSSLFFFGKACNCSHFRFEYRLDKAAGTLSTSFSEIDLDEAAILTLGSQEPFFL